VSRRLVLVASCAALAALAVPPARATALTSAQVRELARAARSDPASLARLRTVDAVDGRRVDLGLALAGATGSELDRRLAVLGGAAGRGAGTSQQAREAARGVLAERRFRRHEAPRPFRGLLAYLSDHVVGPIAEALGGRGILWLVLAGIVLAASAAVASRLVGRSAAATVRETSRGPRGDRLDPRRLEREADEAERKGELERAIRLRFRAGLLRLDRAHAIELREPVTTGALARRLRSGDFDRVAASFDEIVYGRRAPQPPDLELSREGWRTVLATAGAG